MLNRRQTLRGLAAAATGLVATAVSAKDSCVAFTPDMQQAKTPAEALKRLREGNARFVAGQALHCDLLEQVRSSRRHSRLCSPASTAACRRASDGPQRDDGQAGRRRHAKVVYAMHGVASGKVSWHG